MEDTVLSVTDTGMGAAEFAELEKSLHPRHRDFAREVVLNGLTRADAAVKVGYTGSHQKMKNRGYELAKMPTVAAYMRELERQRDALLVVENKKRESQLSPGSAEWIIFEAADITQQAKAAGQFGAAVSALNLLAKRWPEFSGGPMVDNRSVNLTLPAGTTIDELKALRDELKSKQVHDVDAA